MISICMPVMGRFRMLEQALHSVLLQENSDWELVVKDGDPEHPVTENPRVASLLNLVGDRLNYAVGRDHGIFFAFNDCFERSKGKIVHLKKAIPDSFLPCLSALMLMKKTSMGFPMAAE